MVGYFLDHDNFGHTTGVPNTPSWADANYTAKMQYIYGMQNLTFGADGGLTAACQAKHADAPHLCFMSPHMVDVVETNLYVFNSKYDAWQLQNELQTKFSNGTTPAEQAAVRAYGNDFMHDFEPAGTNKNGGFITSCICHGCPWDKLTFEGNKTAYEYYADWANSRDFPREPKALVVDSRGPNGDGDLTFSECAPFP